MGRIIGYQYDDNVQDGDAWIGSEDGGGRTKQYTAEAVANYLNIQGKISIVGQMTYKYGVTPLSGPGTFAVFGGGTDPVAFSAITKLTLSNTDVSKQRVVEFLNLLVGSDILISKQSAISTFGYYSIDNYAVNATDPAYYDLGVTFKSGNGSMEAEQIYETQNFTLAAEENISTLQTTIDSGNTYQASTPDVLWTWNSAALVVDGSDAPDGYEGIFSGKYLRLRSTDFPNYTTLSNGSLVMPLPGAVNTKFRLSANPLIVAGEEIGILSPATSGTLALTTDITASPWDTVTGGINYANGNVGIGTTTPGYALTIKSSGNASQDFILIQNSSNNSMFTVASDPSGNANLAVRNSAGIAKISINTAGDSFFGGGNVGIGTTNPLSPLHVASFASGPIARFINTSGTGGNGVTIQGGNGSGIILSLSDYSNIERLRVNGDGNVGIGTTAPGYNLHIADTDATINLAKTDGDQYLRLVGGSGTNSDVIAQRTLTLQALSGNVLLQPTGNVGIGTTSPGFALDVHGDSTAGVLSVKNAANGRDTFRSENAAGTRTANIGNDGSGHGNILIRNSSGTTTNYISGNGNSYLNGGNVGIGTTSPGYKLDVSGSINSAFGSTGGYRVNTNRVLSQISGAVELGVLDYKTTYPNISFNNDNTFRVLQNGSTKLILNSSGNVGIGTTSPTKTLDVNGEIILGQTVSATVDASYLLARTYSGQSEEPMAMMVMSSGISNNTLNVGGGSSLYNAATALNFITAGTTATRQGSSRMYINSDGNVGIGTTSPSYKLEVDNSANAANNYITVISNNGNNSGVLFRDAGGNRGLIFANPDNSLVFMANGTSEKMRITSAGNVGIGTTSPSEKLEVSGRIKVQTSAGSLTFKELGVSSATIAGSATVGIEAASNFRVKTNITNEAFTVLSTGKVGIGTTSPSQKLEVDGQVLSDGYRLAAMQTAPATRNSTGTLGEIVIDGNHIYVCYATDSWSRVALDTSW